MSVMGLATWLRRAQPFLAVYRLLGGRTMASCKALRQSILIRPVQQQSRIQIRTDGGAMRPPIAQQSFCTSISASDYEKCAEAALEFLTEQLDHLGEICGLSEYDVAYATGVLTLHLGSKHGTYVINKQTPNKQIWLSSPISGPKRYDYHSKQNQWIYAHDGVALHELLARELTHILGQNVSLATAPTPRTASKS